MNKEDLAHMILQAIAAPIQHLSFPNTYTNFSWRDRVYRQSDQIGVPRGVDRGLLKV